MDRVPLPAQLTVKTTHTAIYAAVVNVYEAI